MILQPTSFFTFSGNLSEDKDLSAIAPLSPDHLIIGADEGHEVDVLKRDNGETYTLEQTLFLVDKDQDEADIEDICCVGSTCYGVGSHSRKRKKLKPKDETYKENRKRLFKSPKPEPTRAVLFRLGMNPDSSQVFLEEQRSLEHIIAGDKLLEQFLQIPSKENGIDIEGLAIKDDALYVGFRSPVLRGNYVPVLVVNHQNFQEYELRFIQMGGRGIRAMAETETGFLIIGGPPGDGEMSYEIYFWEGKDMIPGKDIDPIAPLLNLGTLPTPDGAKAEGLALMSESADQFTVLIVYDGIQGGKPTLFNLSKSSIA